VPDPTGGQGLTAAERVALDAVDRDYILALLAELVAIPSVGGDEVQAQARVAREMRSLGMAVDEWDIDIGALSADPDYSTEVERDAATGVVGLWEDHDGERLMLNGHIDVVPVGDPSRWESPPWKATERDGVIFGRGTADMKGGLVCALAAVRAMRTAEIPPAVRLMVASVVGEEDGGTGTLATLLRGHSADAAVILEPTNGAVAPSQAGALGFRLTVRGSPAHGAARLEGVSAIEKFEIVHRSIRALEATRNERFADPLYADYPLPLAISIGTLRAGEWSSTVPDTAVAEGRYGVGPEESVAEARTELTSWIASETSWDPWLREHPPEVEWWGGQFHPAVTPEASPLVTDLAACHLAVTGWHPPIRGVPYGSDLRHLVNRGAIPTVLYGPGDPTAAHRANEHVPIADLLRVTNVLVLAALRFGSS
jgi:acetylornithine deacetylase